MHATRTRQFIERTGSGTAELVERVRAMLTSVTRAAVERADSVNAMMATAAYNGPHWGACLDVFEITFSRCLGCQRLRGSSTRPVRTPGTDGRIVGPTWALRVRSRQVLDSF